MREAILNFFTAPVYENDPEKTLDARTTHRAGVVMLGLSILTMPIIAFSEDRVRQFGFVSTSLSAIIWLFAIFLVKRERRTAAKIIILSVNTLSIYLSILISGGLGQPTIIVMLFLLAAAHLFFPTRGTVIYGAILLILASSIYGLQLAGIVQEARAVNVSQNVFLVFIFTLLASVGILAISSANYRANINAVQERANELRERNKELGNLKNSLELKVTERTTELEIRAAQLQAIASVARTIASVQDIDILLPDVTKLVSEEFGFYHVGIFLLDANMENAVLRAANSQGGKVMLERNHSLKLDANSIVGFATSRGEPRIALDVGADAVFFDNPDLPETRSEMALPLRVGGNVIGALDVQSKQPNAFSQNDIALLSTLADQVAIAIENARLFTEAREALKTSEETFTRYVKREWGSFARQAKSTGYTFDGHRTIPLDAKEQSKKTRSLPLTGRLTLRKDAKELSIPIRLRGQVIGYLDVKPKNDGRKWTQDDMILLEAAADRAALAIENARLVETAERRASRERTIGEISTKIGAVSDLDSIMQAAVEELGRKIGGAAEVIFELDTEQDKPQV